MDSTVTVKKLTKLGNSQAFVIDKQTLAQMGLSEAGVVSMTLHGRQLVITPAPMAAAYLFHLCSNHGFVDGNKRTAVGAALVFLDVNGFELALTIDELEQITVDFASGSLENERVTELLEAAIRPSSSPR